jgi:hypothetical protein
MCSRETEQEYRMRLSDSANSVNRVAPPSPCNLYSAEGKPIVLATVATTTVLIRNLFQPRYTLGVVPADVIRPCRKHDAD